jgi:DNA-binding MarR family transcriptional regulator
VSRKIPPVEAEAPSAADVAKLMMSWMTVAMRLSQGRSFSRNLRSISDLGLTMPMMAALHVIAFDGKQTMTTLVDHLGLSTSATSHLLQRLVELGLCERTDSPGDRRQKVIALSKAGTDFVAEITRTRFEELQASLDPLSPSTRTALFDVLGQVVSELSLAIPDMMRARGCPGHAAAHTSNSGASRPNSSIHSDPWRDAKGLNSSSPDTSTDVAAGDDSDEMKERS